jgi:hypothetical protein
MIIPIDSLTSLYQEALVNKDLAKKGELINKPSSNTANLHQAFMIGCRFVSQLSSIFLFDPYLKCFTNYHFILTMYLAFV